MPESGGSASPSAPERSTASPKLLLAARPRFSRLRSLLSRGSFDAEEEPSPRSGVFTAWATRVLGRSPALSTFLVALLLLLLNESAGVGVGRSEAALFAGVFRRQQEGQDASLSLGASPEKDSLTEAERT